MVILITGATHTGKTLLAQKLLETLYYPYVSMDHIKMGLIRSGLADVKPDNPDEKITAFVWPVIREIVKTAVENGQNLIVEGCYVPADWKRGFTQEYLCRIKLCCLVMTENYIRSHFDIIEKNSSVIERRVVETNLSQESIMSENNRFFSYFKDSGGLTLIDSDYKAATDGLINKLSETCRERSEIQ